MFRAFKHARDNARHDQLEIPPTKLRSSVESRPDPNSRRAGEWRQHLLQKTCLCRGLSIRTKLGAQGQRPFGIHAARP